MKKTYLLLLLVLGISLQTFAQTTSWFGSKKQWILIDNKIEKDTIQFTPFDTAKVSLNTMVLKFMPKGKIMYDYQSDENIDACLGVDFLDIDTDASSWFYNPQTKQAILQIKGGYASIDDFKFKRIYKVELLEGNLFFYKTKEIYFKDLTQNQK